MVRTRIRQGRLRYSVRGANQREAVIGHLSYGFTADSARQAPSERERTKPKRSLAFETQRQPKNESQRATIRIQPRGRHVLKPLAGTFALHCWAARSQHT